MRHNNYVTNGFLLVEISIVLSLLIIVIMLAMPHMSFLKKQIVYSEIEKIATVCLFLRQQALVTHQEQQLLFDQKSGNYSSNNCIYSLAPGIRFGVLSRLYGPPSNPTSLIEQPITFHNKKILFHPDGTISSGTIYLVDTSQNCCYALTIPSAQIPFIRKYEYQQQWVQIS